MLTISNILRLDEYVSRWMKMRRGIW